MRNIFGVDQSIGCTGITHYTLDEQGLISNKHHYFTTGVKSKSKVLCDDITPWFVGKIPGFIRVIRIAYRIDELLSNCDLHDNDVFALEGYSYGSSGQSSSLAQLAELGGIIKFIAKSHGLNVRTYAPTTVKKFATGKGAGGKPPMYLAYKTKYLYSNVLKYYDTMDKRLPIDIQLEKDTYNKPLCDLIDSQYIADMAYAEAMLRQGHVKGFSTLQLEIFTERPKPKRKKGAKNRPKPKPSLIETPYL